MAKDLAQAIKDNAESPKKAAGDSGSVEQHALTEQIEADRYLASKKAARSKGLGVVFHLLADVKVNGRSEDTFTVGGMDWAEDGFGWLEAYREADAATSRRE